MTSSTSCPTSLASAINAVLNKDVQEHSMQNMTQCESHREQVVVKSETDTATLAHRLAQSLPEPCTIFLRGDLGAGKTTFARYFLAQLGHVGAVKSPTYTLVEPYELSQGWVYHFDLYRVRDPLELEMAGFEELFDQPAIRLIEWPERGAGWLPPADVEVRFQYSGVAGEETQRQVEVRYYTQ